MSKKIKYLEGDILIITDKSNISTYECRPLLKEHTPYTIESVSSTGSVYINVYGKDILIFDSDIKSGKVEIITLNNEENEDYSYPTELKIGDKIEIIDISAIEGAEKMRITINKTYEVAEEIQDIGVLIEENGDKLLIKQSEYENVRLVDYSDLINELELTNVNHLIDKTLEDNNKEEFNYLYEKYLKGNN